MLEVTLRSQLYTFVCSMVSGILAGAVYTLFGFLRSAFKNRRTINFICDVIFMLVFAIITYIFSVGFCDGFVRVYVLVGEIIGFLAFNFTLGSVLKRIFCSVYGFMGKITLSLQKNIAQIAKKLLKQTHKMLYNKHKKKTNSQI